MPHPVKDPVNWLYPPIEPIRTGMLEVSKVHTLYWEESGNPSGKPVVFLHGGPGGGTDAKVRRFFDPEKYRIVLFDQRGCGKSTPYASARGEHDVGPRRRHREAPRAPRDRALAGLRRVVGQDARPRLRRDAPRARHRARPARDLPPAQEGDRLVLPGRRVDPFPGRVGALPQATSPRPSAATSSPRTTGASRATTRGPPRGGEDLERLGRRDVEAPSRRVVRGSLRGGRVRPRLRAHRVPLLREPRFLLGRRPAPARRRKDPPHPGRHRPGTLRRRLPDR